MGTSLLELFNTRGNAYSSKGQFERAIRDFDQVIRIQIPRSCPSLQ